jgi:hypothetical protein
MTAPIATPPYGVVILRRARLPDHVDALLRSVRSDPPLVTLAHTLARSGSWRPSSPVMLVVRAGPTPVLAAIGRFDAHDEAMLAALRWQLEHVLPRLRHLDHDEVRDSCGRLAIELTDHLGSATIQRAHFTAIPRGGLIVLGNLAYALGRRHDQITTLRDPPPTDADAPLVIVDDCILSGARISLSLDALASRRVVVATLASHPDARCALMARHPNVEAVLSAIDLHDHAPGAHGTSYPDWVSRWRERSPQALWIGQPDHVCFPWHEPDVGVWDPVQRDVVRGWGMLPAELCLAQARRASQHEAAWSVFVLPEADAPARVPSDVVYASIGDTVVIAHVDEGHSFAVEGVAATMWHGLVSSEPEDRAVEALAERYDCDPDTLRTDLRTFADELTAMGLLRESAQHRS